MVIRELRCQSQLWPMELSSIKVSCGKNCSLCMRGQIAADIKDVQKVGQSWWRVYKSPLLL